MRAVNNQLDMFGAFLSGEDLPVPTHHIKVDKPLYVTELFAGYGSQSLALKYLGVEFKHNVISEWAIKSIQAYKDLHYSEDHTDYSKGKTIEEIRSFLYGRISRDYNTPLTNEQIDKMKESEARLIYSNMICTHNLGSIVGIKAEELGLKKENYNLVTYSFPCQDLSNAGKLAGINENTRSGLLLQVERILRESVEKGLVLPDLLMMENVPGVHGTKTIEAWNSWLNFLNSIGYHNAWQDCNSKDYGIPQSRNRCFMFSWLDGGGYYEFPKTIPLTKCLGDMLEDNVDEKYYLSGKTIDMFVKHKDNQEAKGNGFKFEPTDGGGLHIASLQGVESDPATTTFMTPPQRITALLSDNGVLEWKKK